MPYIPNIEGTDTEVKAFQNKVLTLRYMMTAKGSDGNLEILWELHKTTNFVFGSIPNNIMKLNNGSEYGGWSSTSPYLYAVEHFYTNKGTLPKSLHQRMNILLKVNGWTRRVLLAVRNSLIFV